MTRFLFAARLAVPALFFSYALFANLAFLSAKDTTVALPDAGLLSGGLTRNLDGVYKKDLPHLDVSFGVIGAVRYAALGEARQGAVVGRDGWLFTAEELRPMPGAADLAGIVATVSDVRAKLALRGAELVVVPLPAKVDIDRDRSFDPLFGDRLAGLYTQFVSGLAGLGLPVVGVRTALVTADAPAFFATDTHWTPHGADLVAATVAASGVVATGSTAYTTNPADPKMLTGDLVGFVTTDAFAPRVGLPMETVPQTVVTQTDAAGDLFGAADADIVLVGTSYSANPDWGFADALMRRLGRDVVNMAQPGQGPLRPMQDYLASAELRDTPPAVVIWEIPIRYLTDRDQWPTHLSAGPAVAVMLEKEAVDG